MAREEQDVQKIFEGRIQEALVKCAEVGTGGRKFLYLLANHGESVFVNFCMAFRKNDSDRERWPVILLRKNPSS